MRFRHHRARHARPAEDSSQAASSPAGLGSPARARGPRGLPPAPPVHRPTECHEGRPHPTHGHIRAVPSAARIGQGTVPPAARQDVQEIRHTLDTARLSASSSATKAWRSWVTNPVTEIARWICMGRPQRRRETPSPRCAWHGPPTSPQRGGPEARPLRGVAPTSHRRISDLPEGLLKAPRDVLTFEHVQARLAGAPAPWKEALPEPIENAASAMAQVPRR